MFLSIFIAFSSMVVVTTTAPGRTSSTHQPIRFSDVAIGVHGCAKTARRAEFIVSTWFTAFPNRVLTMSDSKDALCNVDSPSESVQRLCDEIVQVQQQPALVNLVRRETNETISSTLFTTLLSKARSFFVARSQELGGCNRVLFDVFCRWLSCFPTLHITSSSMMIPSSIHPPFFAFSSRLCPQTIDR